VVGDGVVLEVGWPHKGRVSGTGIVLVVPQTSVVLGDVGPGGAELFGGLLEGARCLR
jgi:hypothetical protein